MASVKTSVASVEEICRNADLKGSKLAEYRKVIKEKKITGSKK